MNKFYHGSDEHLPVGTILTARPDQFTTTWGKNDWCAILERFRPVDMLAQHDAIFMCDNDEDVDAAGGGTEWVFTVKPLGRVEKHDMNWGTHISMLLCDDPDNLDAIQKAAINYWNGVPYDVGESLWEYLTPQAEIVAVERF